jgi:formylglycine-generating enzyme required for sulfatase activity
MVGIPSGSFTMGSNDNAEEKPSHTVRVTAFEIGKYEVTQGQWKAVMGANPSRFNTCGDDCPVEQVSWDDTQQFIQKLNQESGKQYRLPSEAEWEYACKAGGTQTYCGGNDVGSVGWYNENSENKTQRASQKQANAWGLHDMTGNVWEWVEDCWHDNYNGAPTDDTSWTNNCSSTGRVLRGGSWFGNPTYLRSAFRSSGTPDYRDGGIGLRLARTLLAP